MNPSPRHCSICCHFMKSKKEQVAKICELCKRDEEKRKDVNDG